MFALFVVALIVPSRNGIDWSADTLRALYGTEIKFDSLCFYRVMLVVWHLGWVDLHLIHSTTCLGLLRLQGLWLHGQSKWADCCNF